MQQWQRQFCCLRRQGREDIDVGHDDKKRNLTNGVVSGSILVEEV
jgi:hypothetical protein